jgi:polar amino acid transport system substrate-binding protein
MPRTSRRRPVALIAALAAAAGLIVSCSSASPANDAKKAAGSAGASSYPKQDVVSAISTDATVRAQLPAAVRSKGTITLGTTLAPGVSGLPHVGTDSNNKSIGLDVDLRNAIGKVLGITWKVENGTFATVIPGVQNGKYDVGQDNFGVTAEREQVVDFATYLTDGQAFLGSKDAGLAVVRNLPDLCGHTVATSPGSTFQQILTAGTSKCGAAGKKAYTVQYFADTAPIFLGLANGKVDIYFGPTLSLKYDAAHISGTKFLGQYSSTPVGFVTAKNSPLAKPISAAVNALIASGAYTKILAKWGVAGSAIKTSTINPKATF